MAIFIYNVPARTMKRERFALAGVPLLINRTYGLKLKCVRKIIKDDTVQVYYFKKMRYSRGRGTCSTPDSAPMCYSWKRLFKCKKQCIIQ